MNVWMRLEIFLLSVVLAGGFFVSIDSARGAGCSAVTCREVSCNSNEVSVPACKAEKCDAYAGARPFPCALTSEVEQCGSPTNIGSQCKNSAAECASGTSSDATCAEKFCPSGKVFCKATTNDCPSLSDHCVASGICSSNANPNCASACAAANPDKPVYCNSSTPLCPSGICVLDEGSCANGIDESGSCSGKVCCKASSNTTCTGTDSNNAQQTGTCSDSASCAQGSVLSSATGCASGKACCFTSSSGKCEDVSGQICSSDCTKESGYETGGTGTCSDSTKPQCCKTVKDPNGGATVMCSESGNAGVVPCGRSCDNPSTPNDETAICTLCHLFLLIKNVSDWVFRVMTYIAFAVLVAMGILYIVSAGNTQLISMAKKGIWASLVGFAIVLLGWVAINVVLMVLADGALRSGTATFSIKTNGSWFDFNCSTATKYTGTGGTGGTGGGGGDNGGGTVTCNGCTVDGVSFNKSNEHAAIIQAGEHYKQSPCKLGYSDYRNGNAAHACGISQVVSKWHKGTCGFDGSDEDMCYKLSTDRSFDLNCGYAVIASYSSNSKCQGIKNLALCYNGGPGHGSCGDVNSGKCYGDRVEEFYNSCK